MGDEPTEQREFIPRIGTFLILLGIFFLIIFLASDFANQADFDWLFLSLLFWALGFFLRRRASPPPAAGRFGMIRKMREDAKKRKEEKAKKKK
jgi:succinate-acetate transporter protein